MLNLQDVTKSFGGLRAVDNCSFEIQEGKITGLIGPNGAGKTTTFNMISGVLRPDSGRILFENERIDQLPVHKITHRGIGRTFQIPHELKEMSVLENVILHSRSDGYLDVFKRSILGDEQTRAMEYLDFLGIAKLSDEQAEKLSFGQKKLLGLACSLMADPELILLDEPAGGVNPALMDKIVDRVRALNDRGITFLIVEHNIDLILDLSDSVIVMNKGEVLTQGTPEEIQQDQRVLDAYLGAA